MDKIVIQNSEMIYRAAKNFSPKNLFINNINENWRNFNETLLIENFSTELINLDKDSLYGAMKSVLLEGGAWEDTEFFANFLYHVNNGATLWGCSNINEIRERLKIDIPAIYYSIKKYGIIGQEKIIEQIHREEPSSDLLRFISDNFYDKTDLNNEIKVGIDCHDNIILLEGRHRAVSARLLGIPIPAAIAFRSKKKSLALSKKGTRMTTSYLTKNDYMLRTRELGTGHWENAGRRWLYHSAASAFAQIVKPTSPERVLEMGTMGVNIVPGSHTIDYSDAWQFEGKLPTYTHDARNAPWPVADNAYELFIALRVFHHLSPNQKAAFKEAKRIARNIIIVTPEFYNKVKGSRGITNSDYLEYNNGVEPTAIMELNEEFGNLYFWNEKSISKSI